MFKLRRYLRNYRKEALLAPLFKLLEASFELIVPLVIARMIDSGVRGEDRAYIIKSGLILIMLALIGLISAITAQYFSAKAAAGFGTELRDELFSHIMGFSHTEADILGRDTLITRISSDSNQIQTGVNMFFRLVLRSPFIVFGAMFMGFMIDGFEGLIFLIVIAVLGIIVAAVMRKTVSLYRNVQKNLDNVLGSISENLTGVRVIRAFSMEDREKRDYNNASDSLYEVQMKAGNLSALMNPLTYAAINLGMAAILYTGAVNVSVGNLTQGEVIALVNYMSQILVELVKLANLIILLSKASACAKRVNEIFDVSSSMKDGSRDAMDAVSALSTEAEILEFKEVNFKYPSASKEALDGISFSLRRGETLGIIGGTGSGKTTLINLIPRFYDADSGEIRLAGHPIAEYSLKSLRKIIGIAEQKNRLFKGSIASNLLWGRNSASEEDMLEAVRAAQGENIIEAKDDGIDSAVEQLGRNLSGGQRQRLNIARALVRKPDILILDDSSSALDYATDARLRRAIGKLDEHMTKIIVSQRVASVKNSDKIIVLEDGRISGIGKHEELLRDCEVYKEICSSQLAGEEESEDER